MKASEIAQEAEALPLGETPAPWRVRTLARAYLEQRAALDEAREALERIHTHCAGGAIDNNSADLLWNCLTEAKDEARTALKKLEDV